MAAQTQKAEDNGGQLNNSKYLLFSLCFSFSDKDSLM